MYMHSCQLFDDRLSHGLCKDLNGFAGQDSNLKSKGLGGMDNFIFPYIY